MGLPIDFAPNLPGETGPEIAARALEAGAFVAAAHPAWYGVTEADIRSLGAIHAVEIYNGTAIDHNDKADSWYVLDLLLRRGARYSACATDDAHFNPDRAGPAARLGPRKERDAWSRKRCSTALKAGDYYSSTGPQIHDIQVTAGERVVVRCSPADRVWLTGHGSTSAAVHGDDLTKADVDTRSSGKLVLSVNHGPGSPGAAAPGPTRSGYSIKPPASAPAIPGNTYPRLSVQGQPERYKSRSE